MYVHVACHYHKIFDMPSILSTGSDVELIKWHCYCVNSGLEQNTNAYIACLDSLSLRNGDVHCHIIDIDMLRHA